MNKFDNIIEKFLTENQLDSAAQQATSAEKSSGQNITTGGGAFNAAADLLKKQADTIAPNQPKTPVQQLQALVDPENKTVTDFKQIKLTPELEKHLENIGFVQPKQNTQTTGTNPSQQNPVNPNPNQQQATTNTNKPSY
jgi:hypothetical protein